MIRSLLSLLFASLLLTSAPAQAATTPEQNDSVSE